MSDTRSSMSRVSRRTILTYSASILAASALLRPGIAWTASDSPVRGGRLRVAMPGAATSETLDFNKTADAISDARVLCLYEGLTKLNRDGSVSLSLAEALEPNEDASLWTARLHRGVIFHDGKEMTAEDVLYSFRYILDEKNGSQARSQLSSVDPARLKKVDDLTIEIGLVAPNAFFPQFLAEHRVRVVPDGTTTFEPAPGTGRSEEHTSELQSRQ